MGLEMNTELAQGTEGKVKSKTLRERFWQKVEKFFSWSQLRRDQPSKKPAKATCYSRLDRVPLKLTATR